MVSGQSLKGSNLLFVLTGKCFNVVFNVFRPLPWVGLCAARVCPEDRCAGALAVFGLSCPSLF